MILVLGHSICHCWRNFADNQGAIDAIYQLAVAMQCILYDQPPLGVAPALLLDANLIVIVKGNGSHRFNFTWTIQSVHRGMEMQPDAKHDVGRLPYAFYAVHSDSTFDYTGEGLFVVTPEMVEVYKENGFVLIRRVFSPAEISNVLDVLENDPAYISHSYGLDDGAGGKSRMCLWSHPPNDVTGYVSTCEKLAGTMETLMGGDEIYHYHTKIMMKDPMVGGMHIWHQDYGYWYRNGCLYPDGMASAFVALDPCTTKNACLEVVPKSHKLGRLEHIRIGDQTGADPERISEILKVLPPVFVEMNPGDVLFFHSNLLHTSGQNQSQLRRWVLIAAFNQRKNNPYKEHHHPRYTPMKKVPNSKVLEKPKSRPDPVTFMDHFVDNTVKSLGND